MGVGNAGYMSSTHNNIILGIWVGYDIYINNNNIFDVMYDKIY